MRTSSRVGQRSGGGTQAGRAAPPFHGGRPGRLSGEEKKKIMEIAALLSPSLLLQGPPRLWPPKPAPHADSLSLSLPLGGVHVDRACRVFRGSVVVLINTS